MTKLNSFRFCHFIFYIHNSWCFVQCVYKCPLYRRQSHNRWTALRRRTSNEWSIVKSSPCTCCFTYTDSTSMANSSSSVIQEMHSSDHRQMTSFLDDSFFEEKQQILNSLTMCSFVRLFSHCVMWRPYECWSYLLSACDFILFSLSRQLWTTK